MNGNHILTKIDVYITIQTLLDNYASIDLMFAIRPYHPSFLDTDQGEQREGGGLSPMASAYAVKRSSQLRTLRN